MSKPKPLTFAGIPIVSDPHAKPGTIGAIDRAAFTFWRNQPDVVSGRPLWREPTPGDELRAAVRRARGESVSQDEDVRRIFRESQNDAYDAVLHCTTRLVVDHPRAMAIINDIEEYKYEE